MAKSICRLPFSMRGICCAKTWPPESPNRTRLINTRVGSGAPAAAKLSRPQVLPCFTMEGKVCMVTGAARGLGFEFSRALVESGCNKLAILDLKAEDARSASKELTDSYRNERQVTGVDVDKLEVVGFGCDIAKEESIRWTFQEIIHHYGRLDSVVASAGIVEHFHALDYPTDAMKRLYDINVHGAFFTAREAAKHMMPSGGGSIVLVSSMSAQIVNVPQPQTPYNASKAAVRQMAASLAVEWAKKEQDKDLIGTWEALTPMGKMGDPEDLSGALLFLTSDASKFVTGADIVVDGGYCCV